MTKVGLGLPGQSIADVEGAAEAAAPYGFDSFSVYGDLGDLPPYATLHASADVLKGRGVRFVGPMGIPVGLIHPEVLGMHAIALNEQLPGQSYVGLVRGAFLEDIGSQPASLDNLESTINYLRNKFEEFDTKIPLYIGGFGPRLLNMAGVLGIDGVKLGGSANTLVADRARHMVGNPRVAIVQGAVSVIDNDRKAARALARREVAKYLHVVGDLDTTLDPDDKASLHLFNKRYAAGEQRASSAISDSLLNKFALAGTPDDAVEAFRKMNGHVDRFELGTPHGLGDRAEAIHFIGQSVINEIGDSNEI